MLETFYQDFRYPLKMSIAAVGELFIQSIITSKNNFIDFVTGLKLLRRLTPQLEEAPVVHLRLMLSTVHDLLLKVHRRWVSR